MVGQPWLTGPTLCSPVVFLMRGGLQTTSGKTSWGLFLLVQSLCKVRQISVDVRDIRGECLGVTARCSLFHVQSIPLTLYCKDHQWHHYRHQSPHKQMGVGHTVSRKNHEGHNKPTMLTSSNNKDNHNTTCTFKCDQCKLSRNTVHSSQQQHKSESVSMFAICGIGGGLMWF